MEARIEDKLTCHAWNADCSMLAVCPNNSTVSIFKVPATPDGPWERVAVLSEHDALVTDIAWAPRTNRILTTSQDRNAYVWNLEGETWKPMLVILRITAAATSVQWSSDEQKFAVGSGAKTAPICYFEAENNFWVSKMLKGHSSTIQSVAWHPTAPVVATACTDFKCRVYSAYLKNVDGRAVSTSPSPSPSPSSSPFTLTQERRRQGGQHAVGRQPQVWHALLRGGEPRLGSRRGLLSRRRDARLLLTQLDRQLRRPRLRRHAADRAHERAAAHAARLPARRLSDRRRAQLLTAPVRQEGLRVGNAR